MNRADASAAASVTRTTSSAKLRSTRGAPPAFSERDPSEQPFLDAQTDGVPLDRAHTTDVFQRRLHVLFSRLVRTNDDRDDRRRAAALLNHGANTNRMPSEDASYVSENARAVARHDAKVVCGPQLAHGHERHTMDRREAEGRHPRRRAGEPI